MMFKLDFQKPSAEGQGIWLIRFQQACYLVSISTSVLNSTMKNHLSCTNPLAAILLLPQHIFGLF